MIDCSITENYFAEKLRLTKKQKLSDNAYVCGINCGDCPLGRPNNGMNIPCTNLEKSYSGKAIAIIQKWSDEHPRKTYLSEFLRHYPNASLDENGTPEEICPHALGLMSMNCCRDDYACVKCWNQPIEERKKE